MAAPCEPSTGTSLRAYRPPMNVFPPQPSAPRSIPEGTHAFRKCLPVDLGQVGRVAETIGLSGESSNRLLLGRRASHDLQKPDYVQNRPGTPRHGGQT